MRLADSSRGGTRHHHWRAQGFFSRPRSEGHPEGRAPSDIFAAEAVEALGLVDICVDDVELEQATNDLLSV